MLLGAVATRAYAAYVFFCSRRYSKTIDLAVEANEDPS